MIYVRALDASGRPLSDGAQFFDRGFAAAALKTLVPLAQRFHDGARHGFPGLLGDRLREPMSFRVLYIEADRLSSLLYHLPPFFILSCWSTQGRKSRL